MTGSNTFQNLPARPPLHINVLQSLLNETLPKAAALSNQASNSDTIQGNCPYNAVALHTVLSNLDIPARVIRGGVVRDSDEHPSETNFSLDQYLDNTGNAHWWVEAQLTTDTWWTIDIWSIHPNRNNQSLVMAGRPDEYIVDTTNPDGKSMFSL